MKTTTDFIVGQRVKMYDPDDKCNVYGHVQEVKADSVLIKWNDLNDPCEHFQDEFDKIKDGVPGA